MTHCVRHYEEPVVAYCRTCTNPYCSRCLVFSFGPDKPPFCVGCALTASGVRNNSRNTPKNAGPSSPSNPSSPTVTRRTERAQRRADKAESKATIKALKRAAKTSDAPPDPDGGHRATNVPAPSELVASSSRRDPEPAEHAVN